MTENGDGTYNFYTTGVDRVTSLFDLALSSTIFEGGDQLWKDLFKNLQKKIEQDGGLTKDFDDSKEKKYGDRYEYDEDSSEDCD